MSARRTLLFVPGTRPERFAKALAAGADMVCVDLEDAVPPDSKADARAAAVPWLAEPSTGPERVVRINSLKTLDGLKDLTALAEASPVSGLVFLPKVDGADEPAIADAVLTEAGSGAGLIALIESVDGLENVHQIASAAPRLQMLMFGAVDLAAELGCDLADEPLLYARSRIVHAARRAGVNAMDVPAIDFRDMDALEKEARRAMSMGFDGKAVLHPDNVAVVNSVFSPTAEEAAFAKRVVELFEASETGLVVLDGKLIERPVIRKMEQVLASAAAAGLK
ncbi:HpcH/HpaI aldolase/citrate lyase family protein [Hoeflea sp.]|uniref:HpcH/HpaI aldolase/citrate lyase family protein n=1 Tax=Hoeflea sp. TaxID=1940281 RepID=UPI003B017A47